MKTIEVSLDALTEHLIQRCPYLTQSMEGTRHCRKKLTDICDLPVYMRDKCPVDCPHRYSTTTRCEQGQCKNIKAQIKKLKA